MTSTARSIFYYSFYMLGVGLGLFLLPDPILAAFGFEPTTEVWVRVLGLMVFCTGILYIYCALTDQIGFFRISVAERIVFFLGALWTGLSLRRDGK